MSKGKVKEYDVTRGCGSIIDMITGQQLMVYANFLKLGEGETLNKGQEVAYDIENRRHENWAINVTVL